MARTSAIVMFFGSLLVLAIAPPSLTGQTRPQLVVLTDIGGDPDDQQSMRRLVLYSNEIEILGLVASAAGVPGELKQAVVRPELIREIVNDYEQVRENLLLHDRRYPPAEQLRRRIAAGNPQRGVKQVGAGRSTDGSRRIVEAVDAAQGPVYVAIWGGATDLAQALFDVAESRPQDQTAAFLGKLRVYAIADQDAFRGEPGTGQWIRGRFPELRYVESGPPGIDRFAALFRGMYQNDSTGGGGKTLPLVSDEVAALNQESWVNEHVRRNHGPLGAEYPLVQQNPGSRRNTRGVKEGDTPSWFFVLSNGLQDPEQPTWGGWGGRFRRDAGGHYIDAEDEHGSGASDAGLLRKWTVARWRTAYQHDFAARLDWCVHPYAEANHPPRITLAGETSNGIVTRRVRGGDMVTLDASPSLDPDRDQLAFRWWVYREPSTYCGEISLHGADRPRVNFKTPADAAGESLHLILEVTDDGAPPLTSYRRVVLTF